MAVTSLSASSISTPSIISSERRTALAAFLLRVSLGALFVAHGFIKVFVFTLPGTVKFFESLGLPGFLAYVTIVAEIGGGLLLLAGAYTRAVALALVPLLIGATVPHIANGFLFSSPNGGWEFPALWTVLLVVQALLGGGAFAVTGSGADRDVRNAIHNA